MSSRIIVPLDGSPLAESALPYALALASATGTTVTLMQVVPSSHLMRDYYVRYDASMEAEQAATAGAALEARARSLSSATLPINAYIAVGDAAEEIVRYAERGGETYIVMATHGRGGVLHWAFGSVARKVLTAATVPTLIVRSETEPERPAQAVTIRNLLVPLDGSTLAEKAVPLARDLARTLGAQVTLVRVVPFLTSLIASPYEPMLAMNDDGAMEEMRMSAREYLTKINQTFIAAGVTSDMVVKQGGAPIALLELLDTKKYDLVVMSTHGRTGAKRWVLGSVAERLVEASHTPVMLVRVSDEPVVK
ncbi:MAG: universal stress protein [Chloroflexota bacterium]|nr:universal stress protein [Chloroflexota bacterium]